MWDWTRADICTPERRRKSNDSSLKASPCLLCLSASVWLTLCLLVTRLGLPWRTLCCFLKVCGLSGQLWAQHCCSVHTKGFLKKEHIFSPTYLKDARDCLRRKCSCSASSLQAGEGDAKVAWQPEMCHSPLREASSWCARGICPQLTAVFSPRTR